MIPRLVTSLALTLFIARTFVLATPVHNNLNQRRIYRFDVGDIHNPSAPFSAVRVNASNIESTELTVASALTAGSAGINVIFTCESKDSAKCAKAKTGFQHAANLVAKELHLQTPITIQANFKPFCESSSNSCTMGNYLGHARPSSYWYGTYDARDKLNRKSYLFPQALVKQFKRLTEPSWNKVDIIAEFNSQQDFFFPGDSNIGAKQYDFLLVVCHEIIHGLGFISAWRNYFQMFGHIDTAMVLTPIPDIDLDDNKIYGWEPMHAFDAYAKASNGTDLVTIAERIKKFSAKTSGESLDTWTPRFLQSGDPVSRAKEMYKNAIAAEPSLKLSLPRLTRDMILSTTEGTFVSGTSISHFSQITYQNTTDFLMRPVLESGVTLQSRLNTYKNLLGNGTRAALSAIGWNVAGLDATRGTFRFTDMERRDLDFSSKAIHFSDKTPCLTLMAAALMAWSLL